MEDNLGWLKSILGMQPQQGPSFGSIGSSSGPAVNNGMPISGLGQGMGVNPVSLYAPPGSNVNPGTPGPFGQTAPPGGAPAGSPMNDTGPLNQLNGPAGPGLGLLDGLRARFGGGQQPGAAPAPGQQPAQNAMMQTAQNLIKGPQIQPTQWMPWLQRV